MLMLSTLYTCTHRGYIYQYVLRTYMHANLIVVKSSCNRRVYVEPHTQQHTRARQVHVTTQAL